MKKRTELDFLKENWIIGIIWNIPVIAIIFSLMYQIVDNLFIQIIVTIFASGMFIMMDIHKWYLDERLEIIEKKLNELENK